MPRFPSSPACGFRPRIASRGFTILKSSLSDLFTIVDMTTIFSVVRLLTASIMEWCTVIGTTRNCEQLNIITGLEIPNFSAIYSV